MAAKTAETTTNMLTANIELLLLFPVLPAVTEPETLVCPVTDVIPVAPVVALPHVQVEGKVMHPESA